MSLKPGIDCGDIYLMEHTYFNIFDDSQSAYFKMSVVVSDMYLNIINSHVACETSFD